MRFARLRLAGFKSFVEPAELIIRDSLTGIVGPNGCGKSNLLEAIRWVMGESSARSLRVAAGGDGMDAVIFAGTARRPARDVAEVTLTLENNRGAAPPQFNEAETLEVTRTIWRGEGSSYGINGRDVRQKDVQLLFADAATGAHSPAMVGQGRVAAIISARPSERRLLLEEAAGISGLAVRRKEAETRLRATDANLQRLEDLLQAGQARLATLRRQARLAERYRELSADIRAAEGALLRLDWDASRQAVTAAQSALEHTEAELADAVAEAERVALEAATRAAALPATRQAKSDADAALHTLEAQRSTWVAERRAVVQRLADLESQLRTARADAERERGRMADSTETRTRLSAERHEQEARLAAARADMPSQRMAVEAAEQGALQAEATAAAALESHTAMLAEQRIVRAQADMAQQKKSALAAEISRLRQERVVLEDDAENKKISCEIDMLQAEVEKFTVLVSAANTAIVTAERNFQAAATARDAAEAELTAVRTELDSLRAEAAALDRLHRKGRGEAQARVPLQVTAGYEKAVAAALGADINASVGERAQSRRAWKYVLSIDGDPGLPPHVEPLLPFVVAPAELRRRLAQIGIVETPPSPDLIVNLCPGQCLVSREGEIWRWDGFEASPGDDAAAIAEVLTQENRRREIDAALVEPTARLAIRERQLADARLASRAAQEAERGGRTRRAEAERAVAQITARLQKLHDVAARHHARRAALDESLARLDAEMTNAQTGVARAMLAVASLPDLAIVAQQLAESRAQATETRESAIRARGAVAATRRAMSEAESRMAAIDLELDAWRRREADATAASQILTQRMEKLRADQAALVNHPADIDDRLAALAREARKAAEISAAAAAEVGKAETAVAALEGRARDAQAHVADIREARAMRGAELSQEQARLAKFRDEAVERFGCQPYQLECPEGSENTTVADMISRLSKERDRLGIVNLRAETELQDLESEIDRRIAEREDLLDALAGLRGSIGALNRAGRARLLEAFAIVDGHFRALFTNLFGGGAAELELVESEDPLHAGLEIRAQPPGKKLQSLSLLSGGEQALTACALIFALFLTNPAPICVLDEVDAPLDDANVERFVRLLEHMIASTDTRFLIVTHNPLTMSRMHRLYGVTMAEPGISQLVSVELAAAQALVLN